MQSDSVVLPGYIKASGVTQDVRDRLKCHLDCQPPPDCLELCVKLTTDEFFVDCNRAYFRLSKPQEPNSNFYRVRGNGSLIFLVPSVWNITFNFYPNGCPCSTLPLNVELIDPNNLTAVTIAQNGYTVTINGLFPANTGFRFWTDARLLRYFTDIEVGGLLCNTGAAAQLLAITQAQNAEHTRYIPSDPEFISIYPIIPKPDDIPLLGPQYPYPDAIFPWTEAIIPWQDNQPFPTILDSPELIILPPEPFPPIPPYINGYNDGYNKFRSVPDSVIFFLGYVATEVDKNTVKAWSLFLTDFVNRGTSGDPSLPEWQRVNHMKKVYMNATNLDKLQFYQEKVNEYVNTFYNDIVQYDQSVVSAGLEQTLLFFLRMHVGYDDYPDFVLQYFRYFMDFIGFAANSGASLNRDVWVLYGNMIASKVADYFRHRATIILQNEDKSSLIYWWAKAGMPIEAFVFEGMHNFQAYIQFVNIAYILALTSADPTNPLNPGLPPIPDFIQGFNAAANPEDQLNWIRELMRILLPNSVSFSRANPNTNVGIVRHLHLPVEVSNMPGANQTQQLAAFFTLNLDQYNADYRTNVVDLVMPVVEDFESVLKVSPLDTETVVDVRRPGFALFPRPTNIPFGFGYRSCAGQWLVYQVLQALLTRLNGVTFEVRTDQEYPLRPVAAFKAVIDNLFAKNTLL